MPDPTAEVDDAARDAIRVATMGDAEPPRTLDRPLPVPHTFVRLADNLAAQLRAQEDAAGVPEHHLGPVQVTIDPTPDGGWVRNTIVFTASREVLLDMGVVEPTEAEATRRRAQAAEWRLSVREAWEAYDAATAALATVQDPALAAVLTLHRPQSPEYGHPSRVVCRGCDAEGSDYEAPAWPCRTVETIAAVLGVHTPDPIRLYLSYDHDSKTWQRP